jgi:hypothetical protein
MPDYNQHVRLLSSEPLVVCASKVYSGLGADIVYGITLKTPRRNAPLRLGANRRHKLALTAGFNTHLFGFGPAELRLLRQTCFYDSR